ncbi:hypothetical protein GCM10009422_15270 [Brevundimonas kwangchunensis]|uniref:Spore coat protein U domain-containing protein n=1 Tax=Brevundimonas kwangchunensis TaxID=322163 RepID=A0ABP3S2D8_9CAUL
MIRWLACAGAALFLTTLQPGVAHAQLAVSRSPATAPVLGNTIRGSSATTFQITSDGVVTRASGNAIRISSSSVTTPTITMTCNSFASVCYQRYVRVTITPVSGSGPAEISRLRVGSLSGTTYRTGSAPAESASLQFDLNPLGWYGSATFKLGMNVLLAANAASGTDTYDYLVTVQFVT